ncbi:hypothetical protein ACQ4PT_006703 [Festuca glaucescens]
MGDGGGRFGNGRGNRAPNMANRGRGQNVWQRDDAAQTSSNNMRGSGSQQSQQSGDRWEIAARESEQRRQEANSSLSGDQSSTKQSKERASSVVITIIEGNATYRDIEQEFNIAFGDSWRCTARAIAPNQYIMRFPTAREVERDVYYGSSMKLRTVDATVRLSTWTASVGAKATLQKAWVKISNIPLDKRCEANAFYVGGLVGISLELDASTLHKPEYVKVLIGCRDVELIPSSAEGCLGDNFYDSFYEIDKIMVGGPPKSSNAVTVGYSDAPSPKRARHEQSNTTTEESSENQAVGSQSESVRHHRQCENVVITDITNETGTQESDEDSAGGELLIETMARENEATTNAGTPPPNKWLVPCSILQIIPAAPSLPASSNVTPVTSMLLPFSHVLSADAWPPLPTITDVSDSSNSPLSGSPDYVVQSPDVSAEDTKGDDREAPTDGRFSSRNLNNANVNIMDKVANVAKKRNLEGL